MNQESEIGKIITVKIFTFHCEEVAGQKRKFAMSRLSKTQDAGWGVAIPRSLTIGALYKARIGDLYKPGSDNAGMVRVLEKI